MSQSSESNTKSTMRISIILSFFLALFLFLSTLFISVQSTLLSRGFILSKMLNEDFYTATALKMEDDMAYVGQGSGIHKEFFINLVNRVDVEKDIESKILSYFAGITEEFDTSKFKSALKVKVYEYASGKGVSAYGEKKVNLDLFIHECSVIYANAIEVPSIHYLVPGIVRLNRHFMILSIVFVVLSLTVFGIIFFINRYKHKVLRYSIYSLFASALMLACVPLIILINGKIYRLAFLSKSMYDVYTGVVHGAMTAIGVMATVFLISGFALVVWHAVFRSKLIRGEI